MAEFYKKKISFTCIKLNDLSNKMMDIMRKHHPDLKVTDMEKASKGKSAEEVNKLFIESASVILRDKVGGKDATGAKRVISISRDCCIMPSVMQYTMLQADNAAHITR